MRRLSERRRQKCGKLPRDLCNFHYDPLTCAIAAGFPDYQAKEEFIEFCPMPEDHTYQIIRKKRRQSDQECL